MAPDRLDLRSAQQWLLAAITHPDGASAGLRSTRECAPETERSLAYALGPREGLPLEARLQLYADSYWSHLTGVLARDFPVVVRTLGRPAFGDLATMYLAQNPSRSWRLSELGRDFPGFLVDASALPASLRAFVVDLARLERAVDEVFDEVASPCLDPQALQGLAPEDWSRARLETIAALRLLSVDFPVNRYYEVALAGARPPLPGRSPRWLAIWRRDGTVWRVEVDRWQHTMLAALASGLSLGAAIERCLALPGATPSALQRELSTWFATWTADGLFARLGLEP